MVDEIIYLAEKDRTEKNKNAKTIVSKVIIYIILYSLTDQCTAKITLPINLKL